MSKKTLKIVKATDNEAIVQVKDNQKHLHSDCRAIAHEASEDTYKEVQKRQRNRKEARTVKTFHGLEFTDGDRWKNLIQMVIQVHRKTESFNTEEKTWQQSEEVSYYVSTRIFSAKESAKIIRDHWGIENKNHYVKDVSMKEDFSRIRKNPHIIAKLRSTALNILRANGEENISTGLYSNCLDIRATMKRYRRFIA